MEILLKTINLMPESDHKNLMATASCVLINGNEWILIKGFCVWEKNEKLSISNPPGFGFPKPFNHYISMSVSLKEKIHGIIRTAYEAARRGKLPGIKNKINPTPFSGNWDFKAIPGRNKNNNTVTLRLVLEEGEDRILFKGLGIGKRGIGFLKAGIVTSAREQFVFSPSIRFTFTVGSLSGLISHRG